MVTEFCSQLIKVMPSVAKQTAQQLSFVGGRPRLPKSVALPICKNCGAAQTFFFQIAFPQDHPWSGQTLAVFECKECSFGECPVPMVVDTLAPRMKRPRLRSGEDLPDGALDLYQRTGRFLVAPTAECVLRDDYSERIRYRPITFEPAPDEKPTAKSKVGGKPGWVNMSLTPGKYLGQPLNFLMQWRHDFQFDFVTGAAAPYHPDAEFIPELKLINHCPLFLGTQLYFYGNQADGRPHVYMIAMRP